MNENMKLYGEIKNEMRSVLEAEANALAWRAEARFRMRDVNTLIAAAKKVNKDIEINAKELVATIRDELEAEAEANAEAVDEANETEEAAEDNTPEV